MDTFDNNEYMDYQPEQEPQNTPELPEEPAQEQPQPEVTAQPEAVEETPVVERVQPRADTAYHGAGTGRKESPYANSPYQRMQQPDSGYRYQPQPQPPKKQPKVKKPRKPIWKPLVAGVLAIVLVAGSCLATAAVVNEYWEERNEETTEMLLAQINDLRKQVNNMPVAVIGGAAIPAGESLTPAQLYAYCVNGVVAVTATVPSGGFYSSYGESRGSGFIISEDGYILTNYHVVEGATEIGIITHDGTEYAAELVGYDSSTNDLAVLKVEATGLQPVAIGKSAQVAPGDMVAAIGNPLGELTATQTVGYVSGIGREVATDSLTTISMIQTDAAINSGNSGGPLFNMRGEVIGITTAKYSGTTGSGASIEGIGFAIPIDDVMSVVDDLIEFGYVTGAYMGVSVQNTDEASASMFGLPTGAYIVSVEKGGAAERAGIKAKDIVIRLGDYSVSNVTDLTRALRNFKAGDVTSVTVVRGGSQIDLEITLDAKPQQESQAPAPAPDASLPNGDYEEWYDYFYRYFGE